jgi:hypothetical protein
MSVNGIWKIEMLGPYGWESVSTAFLEDGRYQASSQDHYAVGSYVLTGSQVKVTATTYSHGQVRTMFGVRDPQMELSFDGEFSGDQINGQAEDKTGAYSITFRATRLADLA